MCVCVEGGDESLTSPRAFQMKATISGPKMDDYTKSYMETDLAQKVSQEVSNANKVGVTEFKVSVETTETEIVPASARRLLANNYSYEFVAKVSDVDGVLTSTTLSDAQIEEVGNFGAALASQYDISVSVPVETSVEEQQAESDAQLEDLEAKYEAAGKEMPASIRSDLEFSGAEARPVVSGAVLLVVAATALLM